MSTNPTPNPTPTPIDAINAFEAAQTAYGNTVQAQSTAASKAAAADQALQQANSDQATAAKALNDSIDTAIEALTGAKVTVPAAQAPAGN